jgi:hypothetical protein
MFNSVVLAEEISLVVAAVLLFSDSSTTVLFSALFPHPETTATKASGRINKNKYFFVIFFLFIYLSIKVAI